MVEDDGFWDDLLPDTEMKRVDDLVDDEDDTQEGRGKVLKQLEELLERATNIPGLLGSLGDLKKVLLMNSPQGKETFGYIKRGIEWIVNPDGDKDTEELLEEWGSDKEGEQKLEASTGLKHCTMADICAQLAMDDDSAKKLSVAMGKFQEEDEAEPLLEVIWSLLHFQTHLGMALGIGLFIAEEDMDD